jgi:hypothetical protein
MCVVATFALLLLLHKSQIERHAHVRTGPEDLASFQGLRGRPGVAIELEALFSL